MKRIAILILLVSFLGAGSVQGQNHNRHDHDNGHAGGRVFQPNHNFRPHTGDGDFDSFLVEFNRSAGGGIDRYIGDICTGFRVPRERVLQMIYEKRMQPADVFMVFQIVRLSGKPYKDVIQHFHQHGRKGWGAVVIALGIKPGSRHFIVLRDDVPNIFWHYAPSWRDRRDWGKGSKKKGSKIKKGSQKKKGSKGHK